MASAPRRLPRLRTILALLFLAIAAKAGHDTLSDPVIRRTTIALPGMPAGTPPVTVLLMSDIHVSEPDMPAGRVARIVRQANALKPDIVLIAGDIVSTEKFLSDPASTAEATSPLAGLKARLGIVAVLGNHEHSRDDTGKQDALRRAGIRSTIYEPDVQPILAEWQARAGVKAMLQKAGISVLENEALRLGPVTIGGLDDRIMGLAHVGPTVEAMHALGPPYVMVGHNPDSFLELPPEVTLMLAGHTHCGQIRYPWGGTPATISHYDCGRIDEGNHTIIVTAGLGTSVVPVRFGTRPDMWLIKLRPPVPKERRP